MNRIKISNGVNLTHINTEKFSTERFVLSFLRPISSVNPSFMSILPFVLLGGCKKFPSILELNKKLDSLYGSKIEPIVRKDGENLIISFLCDVINNDFTNNENLLEEVFNILLEIIYNPLVSEKKFNTEVVNSEKNNQISRINAMKNDKRVYANNRMLELMCKNEPFSISTFGTIENTEKINETNLYNEYLDVISNSKIELFYCGKNSVDSLNFDKITSNFSGELVVENNQYSPVCHEIIETLDISQGKLSMGFRTNMTASDDLYPALILFNTIFGGSTSSKLFENVREKMSLCYYASSRIDRTKSIMTVNSGIEIDKFEIAKKAILEQFNDVVIGNFTDEEINSAKLTVINSLRSSFDSSMAMESYYMTQIICSTNEEISTLISAIENCSKEQIMQAGSNIKLDTIYFLKGDEKND